MALAISLLVRGYLKKMLLEAGGGMKVLVVDPHTMATVSAVYTHSEILQQEVFLVEYLDEYDPEVPQDSLIHMKAVCFLRPTTHNISILKYQLSSPKYGEYHIFFSNMVQNASLQALAEADENQVVKQVQEYFADFVPLDQTHFTLTLDEPHMCFLPCSVNAQGVRRARDTIIEGLSSVLLSMKRRPLIRYQTRSIHAKGVALDLWRLVYEQEVGLFDFRRGSGFSLLLIVDRLDDPVTPLLTQWTYQAMVHELVGISHHRVDLRALTGRESKDQGEVVLSPQLDKFYEKHMYDNYGDLGKAIKSLVDEFRVLCIAVLILLTSSSDSV
mmetsp:Transcript_1743/g.3627  ORF Transcript_1743/g.3627 Transcript_1743/m.3627 type:complete len:328 (-) Transcript_1743:1262-2245(-)